MATDDRGFLSGIEQRPAAPTVAIYPPKRSFLGRLLTGMILVCILVLLLLLIGLVASALSPIGAGSAGEEYFALSKTAENKIAILTLDGTIYDGEDGFLKEQIDQVREDKDVKALVLRVNSPGGTITGSDYLHHQLKKLLEERQLPMVVSIGSMAASGGYYVAMAAGPRENVIFAEPTSWTGSIGVIIPHYNAKDLLAKVGVEESSIKSHEHKQMGSYFREMTDEERAIFQGLVDDGFARFREIVYYGRPRYAQKPADFDAMATGQIFTTKQAIANGLVDKEGFIEDAIARALELAGLSEGNAKVIKYGEPGSLYDSFTQDARSPKRRGGEMNVLSALEEMATPRAYYLFTSLPIGLSSRRD